MYQPAALRRPIGALFMVEVGREHGIGESRLLQGTGIAAEFLADPGCLIAAAHELAIVANLVAATHPAPGLGLEAGQKFRLTSYGIWAFALISSTRSRDALAVAMQFADLTYAFTEMRTRERGSEVDLVFEARMLPVELRQFLLERDVAGALTLGNDVIGARPPLTRATMGFPEPPPTVVDQFVDLCGVRPTFGARETTLSVDADLLDFRLPQANPGTRALAFEECRRLVEQGRRRTGVAGQVRDLILTHISDGPDAGRIAGELHMSTRTLRQRLSAEDTSYRQLLDEVRERLAEELLLTTRLPIADVSRRLGYVEVTSFSQAFRRWKPMSPRVFRQTMSGSGQAPPPASSAP